MDVTAQFSSESLTTHLSVLIGQLNLLFGAPLSRNALRSNCSIAAANYAVQDLFILDRLNPDPRTWSDRSLMPVSKNDFDPVAIVVDWLDACRRGDLDTLLGFYDNGAVLECGCEGIRTDSDY